jgi:hypothetical protein
METGCFYVVHAEEISRRQLGRRSDLSVESRTVKRRLGGWCEMAASLRAVS